MNIVKKGDLVKLDCGAMVDGYPGDNAITIDLGNHEKLVQSGFHERFSFELTTAFHLKKSHEKFQDHELPSILLRLKEPAKSNTCVLIPIL